MKPGPCSTAPASQAEAEIPNYLAQETEHYFSIFKDVFASTDVHGLKTLSVVGLAVGKERKLPTINGAQSKMNCLPQFLWNQPTSQ